MIQRKHDGACVVDPSSLFNHQLTINGRAVAALRVTPSSLQASRAVTLALPGVSLLLRLVAGVQADGSPLYGFDVDSVSPPPLVAAAAAGWLAAGRPLAGCKAVRLATVKVPGLYEPWTATVREREGGGGERRLGWLQKNKRTPTPPPPSPPPHAGRSARRRAQKGQRPDRGLEGAELCAGRVKGRERGGGGERVCDESEGGNHFFLKQKYTHTHRHPRPTAPPFSHNTNAAGGYTNS